MLAAAAGTDNIRYTKSDEQATANNLLAPRDSIEVGARRAWPALRESHIIAD